MDAASVRREETAATEDPLRIRVVVSSPFVQPSCESVTRGVPVSLTGWEVVTLNWWSVAPVTDDPSSSEETVSMT